MKNYSITRASEAAVLPIAWLAKRQHTGSFFEVIALVLRPGESMPKHTNDFVVLFGVSSGLGILELDQVVMNLSAGDWVELAAGSERGWRNEGDAPLELLVIKMLKNKD